MNRLFAAICLAGVSIGAPSTPIRSQALDNPLLCKKALKNLEDAQAELLYGNERRGQALAGLVAIPARVTYFIDSSAVPSDRVDDSVAAARAGVQKWQATGVCELVEATNPDAADVVIQLKPHVRRSRWHAGYITCHRLARYGDNGVFVELSAIIEIADRTPWGRPMAPNQTQKAVMHELGHMFGLEDTQDPEDLMGPVSRTVAEPQIDSEALTALAELDMQAKSILALGQERVVAQARGYVPTVFNFAEPR